MAQTYPMTITGKKELEEKLAYLKEEKLKEMNNEIICLRGHCDFLDDAYLREMSDKRYLLQDEIKQIEEMLYNSVLINPKDEQSQTVTIGSRVTFMEIPDGDEETYTIVGTTEVNPMEQKISMESPIGKSLLGSKINDKVFIEIPSGKIKVKVIGIR